MISRLRARGASRVRIVITPSDDESAALAKRGINGDVVTRVAQIQGYGSDVAATVLLAEGSAVGHGVAGRLSDLLHGGQ